MALYALYRHALSHTDATDQSGKLLRLEFRVLFGADKAENLYNSRAGSLARTFGSGNAYDDGDNGGHVSPPAAIAALCNFYTEGGLEDAHDLAVWLFTIVHNLQPPFPVDPLKGYGGGNKSCFGNAAATLARSRCPKEEKKPVDLVEVLDEWLHSLNDMDL